MMKMELKSFKNFIADTKIILSRGQSWFYEVRNAVVMSAAISLVLKTSVIFSVILTIILLFLFYLVGLLDLRKFRIYQTENELNTSKYNPHLNKISKIK